LKTGWWWETTPLRLSGMQPREGRDPKQKIAEGTQKYNRTGFLLKICYTGSFLRGSAAHQQGATASPAQPGCSIRSHHRGASEGIAPSESEASSTHSSPC
jgi:hypothetical protein